MILRIAALALMAAAPLSAAKAQDATVHQIQFRGSPGGGCPDGYDFNFSDGRCYPNGYRAPGTYRADPYADQYRQDRGYGGRGYYRGDGGGGCPDGWDFNYDRGRCYPQGRRPPGTYAR